MFVRNKGLIIKNLESTLKESNPLLYEETQEVKKDCYKQLISGVPNYVLYLLDIAEKENLYEKRINHN